MFQSLPRFFRKMVLFLLTKFCIAQPLTNIPSLRRFDLGSWQTSKQNYREIQYRENIFRGDSRFASLSQRNGFVFVGQIWNYEPLNQYWLARKIQFRILTEFKTDLLGNSN